METRANYALIGLFTLAVLVAGFGFVYWFSGRDASTKRDQYRVVFAGSVAGLNVGNSVLFNGLRVGEVKGIALVPEDPKAVMAVVEVDRNTPIKSDTKATLEVQMLSGVATIALTGGDPGAPKLESRPGAPPTIVAERSGFQDILATIQNIGSRADDVMVKVSKLIDDNRVPINDTVTNINKFSKALGDNADGVNHLLASVSGAAVKIDRLATELEDLSKSLDKKKLAHIVDNTDKFVGALGTSSGDVEQTIKHLASLSGKLDRAADQVEGLMKAASSFLSSDDGKGAFGKISDAAESIRSLADNLDKRTAEISAGLTRFANAGLREYEALASDGRRTLLQFNRVLQSVERNPQQFILGGQSKIPERR
jgi:phospholipid/cholesterol/gamma-HCH transport system substrate-binding protein